MVTNVGSRPPLIPFHGLQKTEATFIKLLWIFCANHALSIKRWPIKDKQVQNDDTNRWSIKDKLAQNSDTKRWPIKDNQVRSRDNEKIEYQR